MSELVPIPLDLQLRRAFLEYEREGKIFDLPRDKFFRGCSGLDMAVVSNGNRASTPLGPAAGPHTQLLQNIVLCWLGGARIMELKTVQTLDELRLPRPCIDAQNVTYNVEWSQELKLEQSLREYVSAAMFIEILKVSGVFGEWLSAGSGDTVFDMSAGYNLEGIRSPRVRAWLAGMKDASAIIAELRTTLNGRFRQYRDLPFATAISDTITLSTFHGCPAEEIEGIVTFLLADMGLNVCVKMNPTLLGKPEVAHLLHDVLGYADIELSDEAFAKDLQFDEALDLVPRLQRVAHTHGKKVSLKFGNTLVVRNHRGVFRDELMYMSGPPLHVITMNLVNKFRASMGTAVPLSFSAGLTANNVANTVAMNLVPVTVCTDLLKPGGYGRLHRYLDNLADGMRAAGANTIPEFVVRHAGQGTAAIARLVAELSRSVPPATAWIARTVAPRLQRWLDSPRSSLRRTCDELVLELVAAKGLPPRLGDELREQLSSLEQELVDAAGLLNTPVLVKQATADSRYRHEQNRTAPRKLGSKLALYDCIACEKCVPVCPNDANFEYEAEPVEIRYSNYALLPDGGFEAAPGGTFTVTKARQFANFADACNDCGNCDVFCPEDGGPNRANPRFFGTLESYRKDPGQDGFCLDPENAQTIHGAIAGRHYVLALDVAADCARFEDESALYVIQSSRNVLVNWQAKPGAARPQTLDMLPYLHLKFLLEAISDPRHVHYANVAGMGS